MKKLLVLFACLSALLVSPLVVSGAFAQFTKVDVTKTPSKTTIWFQTQKAKCEKVMESVQTSQFGQFVGDAVKYTKDGIKYAKDMYEKGMDLYNQVKDDVLDSTEYKSAMISKEIAEESKKLKEMQESKLKKQEDIQAEIDLLKEQTAAKVGNIRQNLNIAEQSYREAEEAGGGLISEQAMKDLPEIKDQAAETEAPSAEMQALENEIDQIQSDLDTQVSDYENEIKEIEDEYQEKILAQGEKITKLTKELSEVASESGAFKKKDPEDPAKALQKNQEVFFSAGVPSIREENKIKKQRKEVLSDTAVEALILKSDLQLSRSASVDKTETKEELADTMPGESEGAGVSAEVLAEQLKVLRSYIEVVLADIKLQASLEVSRLHKVSSVPMKTTFNLCDYTDSSNVGLAGVKKKADGVLSTADKLQETAAKAQEKYNQAKETANKVQEAVSDAAGQYQQVKDLAGDAKGAVGQIGGVDPSTIGVF